MSNPEENLEAVPLSDLDEGVLDWRKRKIQVDVGLGREIAEGVTVNVDLIRRMCNMAGIDDLLISCEGSKNGGREDVSVVGVDGGSEAVGGFAANKTPKYESDEKLNDAAVKCWNTVDLTVDLNRGDIVRQIEDVRNPEDWAKELDSVVRQAVLKQGLRHLLRVSKFNAATFVAALPASFYLADSNISIERKILAAMILSDYFTLGVPVIAFLGITGWYLRDNRSKSDKFIPRISVANIAGMEIDRAVILGIMGLRGKLFDVVGSGD